MLSALLVVGVCLLAAPARAQSSSQKLFTQMLSRLASNDSLRQTRAFSYDLHLAGTFYLKDDSAQVAEDWHITTTSDSIRARLISRQTNGKAEVVKQYAPPLKLASSRRAESNDPLMAVVWELLNRIKKDAKAQVLIDGTVADRDGAPCFVLRFLAKDRAGNLLIGTKTAQLERIEWAYGKSLGVSSSSEKSLIELAPVLDGLIFPTKLVFNERSRTLLRRSGAYTEIATTNFQHEEQ